MDCEVRIKANGKESELHKDLLKRFGSDFADSVYAKVEGADFKERFGDWEANLNSDYSDDPRMGKNVLDSGEPKMIEGPNKNLYFNGKRGRIFIHRSKFDKLTVDQVDEISNQLLYEYMSTRKNQSFNDIGEKGINNVVESIEDTLKRYKEEFSDNELMLSRLAIIEEYKDDFKDDVKTRIESMGFRIKEKILNEKGEATDELSEDERNSGGLNIKESFESNSKDGATANTKLFLSQIKNVENRSFKAGAFLGKESFVPFEEVWGALEPRLADTVNFHNGETVRDTFNSMMLEVKELGKTKPWAAALYGQLTQLPSNKKTEFVQAFSKARLNFYVTTYDEKTGAYKLINATRVNSRDSKIRNEWDNSFKDRFIKRGSMSDSNRKKLAKLSDRFIQLGDKVLDSNQITQEDAEMLATMTEFFGVKISLTRELNSYLQASDDKEAAFYDLTEGFSRLAKDFSERKEFIKDGEFIGPFNGVQNKYVTAFSKTKALFATEISENNILANGGKSYWSYASPGYLHNTVNEWKYNTASLKERAGFTYNKNSRWTKHLLATEKDSKGNYLDGDGNDRAEISKDRLEKMHLGVSSSFKSVGKNNGVDNKEISYPDAVVDSINKILQGKISNDGNSIFSTIVPADKSRKLEIAGMPMFNSRIFYSESSGVVIPKDTVDVFVGYFEDEYNRMKDVSRELDSLPEEKKVVHYHTGRKNGLKSQLFPSLSAESKNEATKELRDKLYSNGKPLDTSIDGFTKEQRNAVANHMKEVLKNRFNTSVNELIKIGVINKQDGRLTNNTIDTKLVGAYGEDIGGLLGDYMINGMIGNVEYMKLFSGDPAYYKDMNDLIKRIPATYTDGQQLRLEKADHVYFNTAVIEGVEVRSKYYDLIKNSVKDKKILEAYERVNTTDAQAWITPNRWKFLMTRLGKWSPVHDSAFQKMISGEEMKPHELKAAAQPMKGVYFEINDGVPTYLKYSQAVLIPQLVKGTSMQVLYDKMTNFKDPKDEIHEVITIDGVKVGAVAPTKIHVDGTTEIASEFELNSVPLMNKGWKLQQDLPTKLMHDTLVGSQVQKNILAGLNLEGEYEFDGQKVSGKDILERIHSTVSELSNIGKEEITEMFDIKGDKITNKNKVYEALVDEFKSRGADDNVISALEKGLHFDAIPQVRQKLQSVFMSMMNKRLTKIQTNGGSFIQVAPFGLETVSNSDKSGIKIVSENYDGKGLKPPHFKNGKFYPGQVFISHSMASKYLPSGWKEMKPKELMKLIDPSALELVGYRIPNQGMSSNDTLEIVGILPEGLGDAIVGYDGIPAKTGSDFDIDKMYVMMHNLEMRDGKLQKVSYDKAGTTRETRKLQAQNKLVDLYRSVLSSKETYDQMMTSIDGDFLKDDIVKLFPKKELKDIELFSPVKQIQTKFEYMSGKFGVAQTANQLVDHVLNQTQDIRYKGGIGIGHVDTDGNTKFDQEMDINGKNKIADSLSAFLNAYVDIAKDPYISRGNHNTITANVAFMMIRAGAPLDFVNRFIGQPILKELVEITKNSEGITSDGLFIGFGKSKKKVSPSEFLRNKYNLDKNERAKAFNLNKNELTNAIKSGFNVNSSESLITLQGEVLSVFEGLLDKSKGFSASIMASKQDTNGGGADMMGRLIQQNRYSNAVNNPAIMGFTDKFRGTMLGTYKRNAVDWIGDITEKSGLFLSSTQGVEDTFNQISGRLGKGEYITDKELAATLDTSYYGYAMSGMSLFKNNRAEQEKLFTDLPNNILSLKESGVNNFLIQELEIKESKGYRFLKIDNKNKPKIYGNKIHRAWMSMYMNPKTKGLAIDLAKYAFAQSAFKKNINEFYSYIPHEIMLDAEIESHIDKVVNDSRKLEYDDNFREQMNRHNWDNTNVVPRISSKNTEKFDRFSQHNGFLYDPASASNSIETKDGTYPEFITVKDKAENTLLYKLAGGVNKPSVDPITGEQDLVLFPLYTRTFKLGYSAPQGKITEYSYGEKINESVVKENKLHENIPGHVSNIIKEAMSNYNFVSLNTVMDGKTSRQVVEDNQRDIMEDEDIRCKKG